MLTTGPPRERRFTVTEYHTMARAGILGEDDRVELIDGKIIAMSPIGSQHASCVDRLTRMFILAVMDQAIVRVRNPIRLDNDSEPEPDVALLVPKEAYTARHPRPDEVLLVVEVAVSTLAFDRDQKAPLYAEAGILEAWLIALEEDCVYVYRQPGANGYQEQLVMERGDKITVQSFLECGSFAVVEMLNP